MKKNCINKSIIFLLTLVVMLSATFLSGAVFVSGNAETTVAEKAEMLGQTLIDNADVYASADVNSSILTRIETTGTQVPVFAVVKNGEEIWYKLDVAGNIGYVAGDALELVTDDAGNVFSANPETTNVFAGFHWDVIVNDDIANGTVSVDAPVGTFPAGAVLDVAAIPAAAQAAVDAAVENERFDGANVAASYTFDIKVFDAEGAEVQPADGQNVDVSFSLAEVANANLDTQVYHIDETAATPTAESLDVNVADATATVTTTGFSYYTVEFTYGDNMYVLEGDAAIRLSDLLTDLGLIGEAESWVVSNPELFNIYLGEHYGIVYDSTGEESIPTNEGTIPWLLSLKPFDTVEWLKVTIDGIEYEITVTDDNTSQNVPSNEGYQSTVETILDTYEHIVNGNNLNKTVSDDEYVKNATAPSNVRQSTSTTSATTFAAGLPLGTIYIDSTKIGKNKGVYTKITNNPAISDAPEVNSEGNKIYYDTSKGPLDHSVINVISGDLFSFTFQDAAVLPDGNRAHLKITYSDAQIVIDQRYQTVNDTMHVGKLGLVCGSSFSYNTKETKKFQEAYPSYTNQDYIDTLTPTVVTEFGSAVTNYLLGLTPAYGLSLDAKYEIVDDDGYPINGTFIFAMAGINLDRDPYSVSGNNASKPLWYMSQTNPELHFFTEAISINSGMSSDYIYVRSNKNNLDDYNASTGVGASGTNNDKSHYYTQVIDENGHTKFIGNKYSAEAGNTYSRSGDDLTYSTGFVTLANANGIKITATGHGGAGSSMNTQTYSSKVIWYRYISSTGPNGNIQTTSEGNFGGTLNDKSDSNVSSNILNPGTYVVAEGKTVTYTMTPSENYQIAKLQVKNANGVLQEINYNGGPLSKMSVGQTVQFRDVANKLCTLTALADGKFTLEMPHATANEEVHVEWERTVGEVTVKKETVNDVAYDDFRFKIKAHKNEDVVRYDPVPVGSIWRKNGMYETEFESTSSCSNSPDDLAGIVSNVILTERIEISGGKYYWKTNVKLSDLGISYSGGDGDLFVDFLNAPSAVINDTINKALNVDEERIYFFYPGATTNNVTTYWNFSANPPEGQSTDPGWYDFSLSNGGERKFEIQQKYEYEVYEETPTGWELVNVDGVVGVNRVYGTLTEETGTTPTHTFLNRKLPSLTVKKETVNNTFGTFGFTVKFKENAVAQQNYTVTATATISDGVASYSFNNNGVAFSMNGINVPAGTFSYGFNSVLDSEVCNTLLDLTCQNNQQITLGTETGTVAMTATPPLDPSQSLRDWVEDSLNAGSTSATVGPVAYTFTAPARDGSAAYVLPTTSSAAPFYDSVNKQYIISINNGGSFTFPYLPIGTTYEVSESSQTGWELISINGDPGNTTKAEGTITRDDIITTFLNRALPDLTISKTVSGNQASRDKYFKFTVNLSGAQAGDYTVDITNADATVGTNAATLNSYQGETNPSSITVQADGTGSATFYLQHNQSIVIKDLSYGATYTVSEVEEDYLPSLQVIGDNKTNDGTANVATIPGANDKNSVTDTALTADTTVKFTNTRDGIIPTGIYDEVNAAFWLLLLALALLATMIYFRRRAPHE